MKLKFFKAAVILGMLAILSANAFAVAQVVDEIKLTAVSNDEISYYCNGCNPSPEGAEGNIVWYKCPRFDSNCPISVRRTSDDHELAVIKINKALAYFTNKKLTSILVEPFSTHPNAVPFDIAGISIPYVSLGDRINFLRANSDSEQVDLSYFQKFYYEVGTGARTIAIDDKETLLLRTPVRHNEKLPLQLCGQEFFDVITEQVRGRNRNSYFLVEKAGADCIVKSYRISTQPDDVWLTNHNNIGARTYPCGKNGVYFAAQHHFDTNSPYSEQETILTNFECTADRDLPILNCPESNQDEKRLCEQQTKNIIFQAGSTKYYITRGKMQILPAGANPEIVNTAISVDDALSIKVFEGINVFEVTPVGDARISFNGRLDDETNNAKSRLVLKEGNLIMNIRGQLTNYILNRPQDTQEHSYYLFFEENRLKSIYGSFLTEIEQGRVAGGISIFGLRIAENLRAFGSNFVATTTKTYNLFPLREGESNVVQGTSYNAYRVRRNGMMLGDIAKAQPGMSGLDESQLVDFMEQIRETSGLYYDELEGGLLPEENRGPRGWAMPDQFGINTRFRLNDVVLIPIGRTFQSSSGNRLTVTSNRAQAGNNLEQRSQRRARRSMDDTACTNIGGLCQTVTNSRSSCILESNQEGVYMRNKCLSNLANNYLCCAPKSVSRSRANSVSIRRPNVPNNQLSDRGSNTCSQLNGECITPLAGENAYNACRLYGRGVSGQDDWRPAYGTLGAGCSNNQLCCIPSRQRSLNQPSTASQIATPAVPATPAASSVQERGTQCRTNGDCNNDFFPFCEFGRCTNCIDMDRGADATRASYVSALPFSIFEGTEVDECEGDSELKLLNERICSRTKQYMVSETTNSNVATSAETIQINCRVALGNPQALCLQKMTSKGMAAYCGISSRGLATELSERGPRRTDASPGQLEFL